MRKSFFSLLLLLSMVESFAQKNSFGITNYSAPEGYELINNDNVLTYFKEDKSIGTYCNIFIYKVMPGRGGTQQDFDFAWTNLLQKPFKVTGNASMQPEAVVKGWKFLIGNTRYTDNGVATLAMLISFSGENNMQAICIVCNNDVYKKDIENFIASVDVTRDAVTTTTPNSSAGIEKNTNKVASTNVTNLPKPGTDKGPVPEVWMKSRFEYDMMRHGSVTKYEWIAIYPGEKFYAYMPTEGYAGLYEKNKDWGKAVWNGNRLNVIDVAKNEYYFDKKSASQMQSKFDSSPHFYKCTPVNGLRIEGAYTQYASLIPSTKNEAQYLIWFRKDGSFDDRGIYVVDLKNPYALADIAPGKGKYSIENYSIFLSYDDGRVKQLGFSGFLDKNPATVTDAYFMGRSLYYRKDKGYNSNLNTIGDNQ